MDKTEGFSWTSSGNQMIKENPITFTFNFTYNKTKYNTILIVTFSNQESKNVQF